MARAIILMLDSLGVGYTDDSHKFGPLHHPDKGAHTLGHIYQACEQGKADKEDIRKGPLNIPHLEALGLLKLANESRDFGYQADDRKLSPFAQYGYAKELSHGKDTPSGHWEMAGVPVLFDWGYFPETIPCFPQDMIDEFTKTFQLPGILGNCHASGTEIIAKWGQDHRETGKPILYTSADSVMQIAAHEDSFGLDRLYELCEYMRTHLNELNIGRVIARPFIGEDGNFQRTGNRRDWSVNPPAPTVLDKLKAKNITTYAIGKISDIYAHQGISKSVKANGNQALGEQTLKALNDCQDNVLIFTNFVDFDMLYGHRRDVVGYAKALEDFDAWLPKFFSSLKSDDLVILTADHGCDPTWPGTDHTREHVPVILYSHQIKTKNFGKRESFADIAQTLTSFFKIDPMDYGEDILRFENGQSVR